AINSSTGVVTVAGAIDREADGASRTITVRATSADGSFSDQSFSISIADVNEFNVGAVSDSDATTNSVAENSSVGTVVGITASASDADATTNAITYSLFDNDGGRFAINSSTGVVTVAGAIDREADGASRTITVRATSADGSYTDQNFSINIADVDEFNVGIVSDTDATANSVAENSSAGTVVGITAAASDADATTNAITYSLFDNDGGRFAINSSTGVVTVAGAIDREADGATRTITVRATSADGSFSDQSFTISIADVDEFNTGAVSDSDATANSVVENAAIGTAIGITASASDADATTNAITYSLADDDGGRFAIDSSSGVVTLAGAIDREADGATRTITVRATSADGSYTDQNFTISIVDVDEFDTGAVSDADAAANSVAENASIGTTVGVSASASDADATTSAITYSLVNDDGGRFAIDSTTGVVTVAGAIDRESDGPTRTITVRATSADGSFSDQSVTINIADVDEFDTSPISDANTAGNTVSENAANGTAVGITAAASDADATNNAIAYSLDDDAGGRFAIDSSTGIVTVANGSLLNYEAATSHAITVRATSADGSFRTCTFTIALTDTNEFAVTLPGDIDPAADSVAENSAAGTSVGVQVRAIDGDGTHNSVRYSLVDDAGGRFVIDATTGLITVAAGADLNYEAATSHTVIVRADSADASFATRAYTIAVADRNEAPSVAPYSFSTTNIDTLSVTTQMIQSLLSDPDGNALTLSSITQPGHGTLVMQSNGSFTYQPNAGYVGTDEFVVTASDGQLSSSSTTFKVNVSLPFASSNGGGTQNSGGSSSSKNNNSNNSNSNNSNSHSPTSSGPTVVTEADIAHAGYGAAGKEDSGKQADLNTNHHTQSDSVQNVDAADGSQHDGESEREEDANNTTVQLINVHFTGPLTVQSHGFGDRLALDDHFTQHSVGDQPWTIIQQDERSESGGKLSAYTFVEPAKWTAISTGLVIWSLRVYQVVATLASTAKAWTQFDPIMILQSSPLAMRDEGEEDGITEKMFDNQNDRQRAGDA
ncbi:MAG: beta strand repeat-containing protein, partial [Aureliella sp.]